MPAERARRKACAACTKAKRPCSKRLPGCDRCERKSILCRYPPINQTAREYAVANIGPAATEEESAPQKAVATASPSPIHIVSFDPCYEAWPGEHHHPCATGLAKSTKTLPLGRDWFYSSDSWLIARSSTPAFTSQSLDITALKDFVGTVQGWLRRWAATGRSPFMHHRLYKDKMPRCVQDAYTVLTTYFARTPENSELCFQIVRDRAAELIEDAQRATSVITPGMGPTTELADIPIGTPLGPAEHLARVHALFVYQMIGLFDGDIVMRAAAEHRMLTLTTWLVEMWNSAELDAHLYETVLTLGEDGHNNDDSSLAAADANELAAWKRWIVSESIRRVWLLGTIVQSIYELLKTGWSHCPGSVNWTPRAGLWDAPDQYAWTKLVADGPGPLFIPSLRADLLYREAAPADVDEFGHAILVAEFGLDGMAKWKARN
ncbi:hypothetical protein GGS26DRAFT_582849 [Hypomontagnella submonticulosa]|nr:hypothetical protein GGS26DRAFT_582849 [Hypomontagnella submonticulosa]